MSTQAETHTGWSPVQWVGAVLAWFWVAVPFAWGLYELIVKIPALFG
jgi:hypothetical protein